MLAAIPMQNSTPSSGVSRRELGLDAGEYATFLLPHCETIHFRDWWDDSNVSSEQYAITVPIALT